MTLNLEARDELHRAGITREAWERLYPHHAFCGCEDKACIGSHHKWGDYCACLPALIDYYRRTTPAEDVTDDQPAIAVSRALHKDPQAADEYRDAALHQTQKFLSRREAAERYSVSVAGLDREIRLGNLPAVKFNRKVLIRPEDVEKLLRERDPK